MRRIIHIAWRIARGAPTVFWSSLPFRASAVTASFRAAKQISQNRSMQIESLANEVLANLYRMAGEFGDHKALVSVRALAKVMKLPIPQVRGALADGVVAGNVLALGFGGMTYRLTMQGEARAAALQTPRPS